MSTHQNEMAGLLAEHKARMALLEPFVEAHGLMPGDVIQSAEQQNARRAVAMRQLCLRYSQEVQLLVSRHTREQDEQRGAGLRQSHNPPQPEPEPKAEPEPAPVPRFATKKRED